MFLGYVPSCYCFSEKPSCFEICYDVNPSESLQSVELYLLKLSLESGNIQSINTVRNKSCTWSFGVG